MESSAQKCVKIFVPYQCMTSDSGLLFGSMDKCQRTVTVVALVRTKVEEASFISQEQAQSHFRVIGTWDNLCCDNSKTSKTKLSLKGVDNYVSLSVTSAGDAPKVKLHGAWDVSNENVITILYDPEPLLSSYVLGGSESHIKIDNNDGHLHHLVKSLVDFQSVKPEDMLNEGDINFIPGSNYTAQDYTVDCFIALLVVLIKAFVRVVNLVTHCLRLDSPWLQTIVTTPACGAELCGKFQESKNVFCSGSTSDDTGKKLRHYNVIWRWVIDVLLGVMLMVYLQQNNVHILVSEGIITWGQSIVDQLTQLLHWMMGVPAGLKLNSQLDQMLGRFFLYHIYLWTGYLSILQPVLSDILWLISASGTLGLSVQLCLVQDLISMMTLHIYCFYVYAARLYNLQIRALSSLFRLFRGKKWNVLRKRVDSATYDVDQLFIGTLLFTILLFLLPTTALYYIVFMLFRLLILSVQGCLHKCVSFINTVPIYSVMMYAVGSSTVAGDVCVQVLPSTNMNEALTLTMQVSTVSWKYIKDLSQTPGVSDAMYSWLDFIKKILLGELVYPWIERQS